jgi:glycosyltransferase involved in cell wall biosynthesis
MAEQAKSLPNVEFTGFLPLRQVEPYFDRASVFVNTSQHEGVPNTFLQAWARGIPTIAFVDTGARLQHAPVYFVAKNLGEMVSEIGRLFADHLYQRRAATCCREYFNAQHSPTGVLRHYAEVFAALVDVKRHDHA